MPTASSGYPSTNVLVNHSGFIPRKKYPMGPPLPLYHPLGRLALSLPPLEPANFGHSTPISIDDSDSARRSSRSSARSRRPAAKLRDAEDDDVVSRPAPISNVSAIAAVAAREIKEKATPRKKRAGGGAGAKRKRKDVDDGDATYPAKRTRNPRGTSHTAAEDADSPTDSSIPLPEVTPTPEPAEADDDSKNSRPERRSTRSSGPKRRDSSASQATSSASGRGASTVNGTEPVHLDPSDSEIRASDSVVERVIDTKEAKEEGEVSDEAP